MVAAAKQMKERNEQATNDKVRVQFDFGKESIEKLDEIATAVGATTRAEVIRRALALFARAVEEDRRGAKLMLERPDGRLVELTPFF